MKRVLMSLLVLFCLGASLLAKGEDEILGVWRFEEGQTKVEVYLKNDKYFARIVEIDSVKNKKGNDARDINNPDPKFQNRLLLGIDMWFGFEFKKGKYENGKIYDARSGKTYSAYVEIKEGELELTGYLGAKWLGKTVVWVR